MKLSTQKDFSGFPEFSIKPKHHKCTNFSRVTNCSLLTYPANKLKSSERALTTQHLYKVSAESVCWRGQICYSLEKLLSATGCSSPNTSLRDKPAYCVYLEDMSAEFYVLIHPAIKIGLCLSNCHSISLLCTLGKVTSLLWAPLPSSVNGDYEVLSNWEVHSGRCAGTGLINGNSYY